MKDYGFSCEFFCVSANDHYKFEQTFPGVAIEIEFQKMKIWLWANPHRRKKNIRRFIVNWLAKVHGRLQEAEVSALVRVSHKREQERADSAVGLWEGYKR